VIGNYQSLVLQFVRNLLLWLFELMGCESVDLFMALFRCLVDVLFVTRKGEVLDLGKIEFVDFVNLFVEFVDLVAC